MRDPSQGILIALGGTQGGFGVIYYPDPGLKEWILGEVESHLSGDQRPAVRVTSVAQALASSEHPAFLVPQDEGATVEELDAVRDQFLTPARNFPVVLFLLRDGPGEHALARCPGLASVVRGRDPDPEKLSEVDCGAELERFRIETGLSPEEWLMRWRAGALPEDAATLALSYRALLLGGK